LGKRFLLFAYVVVSLWVWNGCLATTHHLNTGRILKPGEYHSTYAFSYSKRAICRYSGSSLIEKDGAKICQLDPSDSIYIYPEDSALEAFKVEKIPSLSTQWRLGLWEKWGPFTGVDMGYSLEIPSTWEFDFRFGLKPFEFMKTGSLPWHHNFGLGWGIGLWADNTWYAEYGLGIPLLSNLCIYGNYRLNYLATQFADIELKDQEGNNQGSIFNHAKRILHQMNFGIEGVWEKNFFLFPDRWHINYHLGYPVLLLDGTSVPGTGEPFLMDHRLNFAIQWMYGGKK